MTTTLEAPTAMIDRVASVLEAFVEERPLTLAEVARRSGLPRSSTHRILQRLVELAWVEREGYEYVLGIRMFEFGSRVRRQRSVHEAALPVMTDLHRRSGMTVYLSTIDGAEVIHLERVGLGPRGGGQWGIGGRQAVETAAPGHALLAVMPRPAWPELRFADAPTCYSVKSRLQLDRELQRTRDRGGIAVDSQGNTLGVTVVAAPIRSADQHARLAVSVCGPTHTMRTTSAVNAVRSAAMEIWYAAMGVPRSRNRLQQMDRLPVGFR
ncbi:IclR family transcriptional regulator [Nocardia cerradoensis]|uniref:Acetate operon repressor n=1 Tax=Nocardia cerradoensis TaxID=85688 RepID=A0A231GV17_9NOCA|nr:IclR family transcriptional regulator [Nocardia cerradoensis]OXR40418.1 Acetate operon repressor [Nocardia cerradoensis]